MKDVYENKLMNTRLKNDNEPFTEADIKIQTIIIKSLLTFWPKLKIIGEEEEIFEGNLDIDIPSLSKDFIRPEIFAKISPESFNINEAIVWVDPIDGTANFINGELDGVTTLIGVSINSKATIGIIGKYYRKIITKDNNSELIFDPKCYFGHIDYKRVFVIEYKKSTVPLELKPATKDSNEKFVIIDSQKSVKPDMQAWIRDNLQTEIYLEVGGTGNEMLCIIEGIGHLYIRSTTGAKKWDTCAGEALIKALGGYLVDMEGNQLEYPPEKDKWINEKGVLGYVISDPVLKSLKLN